MFNLEQYREKAMGLFAESINKLQKMFQDKFGKIMQPDQIRTYFGIFCENFAEAAASSINIMQQFSQQKILSEYEQLTHQELSVKYNQRQNNLKQQIQNDEFDTYLQLCELQKSEVDKLMKLRIEGALIQAQNQYIKQFTNYTFQVKEMVGKYQIDDSSICISNQELKELQSQLYNMSSQLDMALHSK